MRVCVHTNVDIYNVFVYYDIYVKSKINAINTFTKESKIRNALE